MTSRLSLLGPIVVVLMVIPKIQAQSEEPTSQRFEFRGNFSGSDIILNGQPNIRYESIALTEYKKGGSRALHRYPAQLINPITNKSLSFNTTFVFQILGLSSNEGEVADGIVFLLGPKSIIDEKIEIDKGTCLAFTCDNYNSNDNYDKPQHRFGVEFDTFMNYLDPDGDHIGININSVNSSVVARLHKNSTAGHNSSISLHRNMTLQSWIEYRGGDVGNIKVWLAENGTSKPQIPHIDFNFSLERVINPISYPGFSAATGNQSSIQTIFSWSFSAEEVQLNLPGVIPRTRSRSEKMSKKISKNVVAGISIATISILVAISVLVGHKLRRNQLHNDNNAAIKSILQSSTLVMYSYKELHTATNGFKELLGKGGSSTVYKAVLQKTGSIVAVKCLKNNNNAQFLAEVEVISNIRHQKLVSLKGWCQEEDKLLLVYEYMSKGSLEKLLFTKDSVSVLPWPERYGIIRSVAEGLAYLHDGLEKTILHRDVKAANVLLDAKCVAKLGDFGLAKMLAHTGGRPESLTRAGTPGYMSPELVYTGRATEKSDVYSYGILVLEVVAGRPCVDVSSILSRIHPDQLMLLDWTWKLHKSGELMKVVDPKIAAECDAREVLVALQLGLLCCSIDPSKRPAMRKCCQILGGDSEVPSLQGLKPAVMDDIIATYGTNGVSIPSFGGSSNKKFSHLLMDLSSRHSSVPLINLSSGTGSNNGFPPALVHLLPARIGNGGSLPLIDFSSEGTSLPPSL